MPDLIPGYRFEEMSRAELQPFIEPLTPSVFAATGHLDAGYAYADAEQEALWRLEDNLAARSVLGHRHFSRRRLRRLAHRPTGRPGQF